MNRRDLLAMALLAQGRLGLDDAKTLYDAAGSATAVMEHRENIRDILPDASQRLVGLMKEDLSAIMKRAEEELLWCEKNRVRVLAIGDADYPARLRQCHDAPLVLFARGKVDLNALRIINVVGTRKCTVYGQDFIASMVKDLAADCPGLCVVSGLAYGIDIHAHRAAMANGLPTVGVVAHGQDMIYPFAHRDDANRMVLGDGAVVTEFFRGTRPEARNFLQRNRIIAGMADATIVVESAVHGGGLVTARIAQDYGREVFAVPGMVTAEMSVGCNNLIRDNKAALITSADDVVKMMMWQDAKTIDRARRQGIERSLFVELSPKEQLIVDVLRQHGDIQSNVIAMHTSLPIGELTSLLFALEMRGVVKALSGNTFHLVG